MAESPPNFDTIASRLIWLRERAGMTQSDLCRATRTATEEPLTPPSIWAIETGKTKSVKADMLFRIAGALKANPDWLRTGVGDPYLLDTDNTEDELLTMFKRLTPEQRSMISAAIKAIS